MRIEVLFPSVYVPMMETLRHIVKKYINALVRFLIMKLPGMRYSPLGVVFTLRKRETKGKSDRETEMTDRHKV